MATLSQRRETILRIIVSEYITSAAPVASESIVRGYSLGISPATARLEMARLEEEGYITRPHVSAGGIPSPKGYRYYVECLLKEAKLGDDEQQVIRQLFYQVGQQLEEWARLAVTVLSQRLRNIALVTLPRSQECHFRHLDLVALQEFLVLSVLMLQEGQIKQRLVTLEQVVSQDELTTLANQLNTLYKGLTCFQIGAREIELFSIEEEVTGVIMQIMEAEDKQQPEQFYLDGWRHLISQPEFRGERMLSLVEALEERHVLNSLLNSLGDASETKVTIGDENKETVLQDCSVVLSNYGACAGIRGAIGVIGPTRMPYSRTIPTVDYLSSIMSGLLSEMYA